MRFDLFMLTSCLALASTSTLLAHGPLLDYQGGEIVVHADGTLGGLPLYEDDLAFNFVNLGWGALPVADGGGHLVQGDTIGLKVHDWSPLLPFAPPTPTYFLYHTGADFADAGSASFGFLSAGVGVSAHTKNFDSINIGQVFGPDDFHDHLGVLLQNGATGVYAFLVSNVTTDRSVAESDQYLMVIANGVGPTEYAKALSDIEKIIVVPELTTSVLTGSVALIGLLVEVARRRRVS